MTRWRKWLVGAVLCIAFGASRLAAQDHMVCPEFDPTTQDTWAEIVAWLRSHPTCDDGETSETLSWHVTHKLAVSWKSLSELARLTRHEPTVRSRVVRHVGGDADVKDLRRVKRNARLSCPAAQRSICAKILEEIRQHEIEASELQR